jgi:hypothetical protein
MQNPVKAQRAIGALFFSLFGGAWLELGVYRALRGRTAALAIAAILIALGAAALFGLALRRYREHRAALAAAAGTPAKARADRLFHLINAG